jgi:hypothetical protein
MIRPGVNTTRIADGEDKPMRCVAAEVNGSGRVTRWFYRSSGELELIELPGGVVAAPSSEGTVRFNFPKGPMAP